MIFINLNIIKTIQYICQFLKKSVLFIVLQGSHRGPQWSNKRVLLLLLFINYQPQIIADYLSTMKHNFFAGDTTKFYYIIKSYIDSKYLQFHLINLLLIEHSILRK